MKKKHNSNKPNIAIIIDIEGWAYYNNAVKIKENLQDYYNIDIISLDIFGENVVKVFLLGIDYDLVYFMWRGAISWLYSEFSKRYIQDIGYSFKEFLQNFVKNRNVLTGVYDHLFINSEQERTKFILENVKDYMVCSKKLEKIYNQLYNKKPSFTIYDGIDLNLFRMYNQRKYCELDNNSTIKIGWTGNSKFTDEHDDDLKGLNCIIKPAIKELKEEGYPIELLLADRNIKLIKHEKMIDYYNNIDLYVCASRTEGTPAPILEAMACGVPIISTDVGIVSEILGKEQRKFIIQRKKEELKEKIIELIKDKQKLKRLSDENLKQIQQWSWENQSELYKQFFDKNLV